MALTVSCPCQARFEVEELFAGQTVACPECGAAVRVPAPERATRRTSGYALASAVLATVGAFTIVGTVAAVFLGIAALVSIRRRREQLAGVGLATFGIAAGLVFTGLTGFALTAGEVYGLAEPFREQLLADAVQRGGPIEVVDPEEGFAIRRPSVKWGTSWGPVEEDPVSGELTRGADLTMVSTQHYAYVDVKVLHGRQDRLDDLWERQMRLYRGGELDGAPVLIRFLGARVRDTRRLDLPGPAEAMEATIDAKLAGQSFTFVVRLIRPRAGDRAFVVRGWTRKARFARHETELREAVSSFRLLLD